jgi:hypothetical protein
MSILSQKLQTVIKRDTGIDVELPLSINRGYWWLGWDIFRWQAQEIGGLQRMFNCTDSMKECIKYGVTQPWELRQAFGTWEIDANFPVPPVDNVRGA